jgi:hypothetical protein
VFLPYQENRFHYNWHWWYNFGTGNHQEDFLDAIRALRRPRADIAIGHDSVALVHLANIATRLGRSLQVDTKRETILRDDEATRLLSRDYRSGSHWAIPKGV